MKKMASCACYSKDKMENADLVMFGIDMVVFLGLHECMVTGEGMHG